MSSADRLRAAAATIRKTAQAATPGPWGISEYAANVTDVYAETEWIAQAHSGKRTHRADAAYIALMSPPVAITVADLLDDVAAAKDSGLTTIHPRLLDLADLILGGQS